MEQSEERKDNKGSSLDARTLAGMTPLEMAYFLKVESSKGDRKIHQYIAAVQAASTFYAFAKKKCADITELDAAIKLVNAPLKFPSSRPGSPTEGGNTLTIWEFPKYENNTNPPQITQRPGQDVSDQIDSFVYGMALVSVNEGLIALEQLASIYINPLATIAQTNSETELQDRWNDDLKKNYIIGAEVEERTKYLREEIEKLRAEARKRQGGGSDDA